MLTFIYIRGIICVGIYTTRQLLFTFFWFCQKLSQIGKKESIADTARVLGRMFDGIEYRGFGQSIVEDLAKYAGVPVWNGLTNEFHPTQVLADILTIKEHFRRTEREETRIHG